MTVTDFAEVTRGKPEKSLLRKLNKSGGRNNQGKVTPCCALPRYEVGDLAEGLQEIWRGKAMRDFRENQDSICGTCDFYTTKHRHDSSKLMDPAEGARGVPKVVCENTRPCAT